MAIVKHTTFSAYRVFCITTQKSYVGISIKPKIRKGEHFSALKHNRHHSTKLQNAYNKYGRSAFTFEIIEENISPEFAEEREAQIIASYDSCKNGYNMTTGGEMPNPVKKTCIWNGQEYSSVAEAARGNGYSEFGLYYHVERGLTSDDQINDYSRVVTWNGIEYPSLHQAAKACGINVASMFGRLKRGHTCDTDVRADIAKPCSWNGISYKSLSDAARANGLTVSGIERRLRVGHTCDTDVGTGLSCLWNGIKYDSQSDAARALGITPAAMRHRVRLGYTCDDDMVRRRK